jgi:hypothetical protein
MPILWVIGFFSFLVAFLVDKWAFLRLYQMPPNYGPALARTSTDALPAAILVHAVLAAWSYSEPTLYDYLPQAVVAGQTASPHYAQEYDGKWHSPYPTGHSFFKPPKQKSYTLGGLILRAANHKNSAPHDIIVALWVVWFVLTKVRRRVFCDAYHPHQGAPLSFLRCLSSSPRCAAEISR